jgi:hypothetical protein
MPQPAPDPLAACVNANATAGFLRDSAEMKRQFARRAPDGTWRLRIEKWAEMDELAADRLKAMTEVVEALRSELNARDHGA